MTPGCHARPNACSFTPLFRKLMRKLLFLGKMSKILSCRPENYETLRGQSCTMRLVRCMGFTLQLRKRRLQESLNEGLPNSGIFKFQRAQEHQGS